MTATLDEAAADLRRANAELRRQLAERTAERDEALEQQTATAEVLQVISASPGDLAPVFEAMLEKAMRLCEAAFGTLWTYDGDRFRSVAQHGVPTLFVEFYAHNPPAFGPGTGPTQILEGERFVHVADLASSDAYLAGEPNRRALVDLGGARTALNVPLRKDDALVGFIMIYRKEVRPFSDKQIALLENFAAQAVIAMENARLLGELRERSGDLEESLEYQTATSDVLKVISRSTFDLQPVLDALLATASRLCGDAEGALAIRQGEVFRYVATVALTPEFDAALRQRSLVPGRGSTAGRVVLEGGVVQIADIAADPEYALPEVQTLGKLRTTLGVPLVRQGETIGVITLAHRRVEPFTEQQIALVSTFADQAVIAMENARLLGELRERTGDLEESLEYQTATSDVLKVISRSTFDLQPVLDTLLQTAARLCNAEMGHIAKRDDDVYRVASTFAFSPEWDIAVRKLAFEPGRGSIVGRTALARQAVQIADLTADTEYALPEVITIGKMRTGLGVPLLREGEPIGVIYLARQRVEPFTERQIDLVRTFADQAVIAIENTRLITETQEALDQQTATAEVLQVINSSPRDLTPVFDAMLDKALRLCEAHTGHLLRFENGAFSRAASLGIPEEFDRLFPLNAPMPDAMVRNSVPNRMLSSRAVIHVRDMRDDESYRSGAPAEVAGVDQAGIRTVLFVPLLKEGEVVGAFIMHRLEVRPFSDKQIALLENFAAQAVIAIENTRLLGELREALEQQTATADVLQVINSSPGDLAPVFEALLDQALALCGAEYGFIRTYDGESFHLGAMRGVPPEHTELLKQPRRPPFTGTALERLVAGESVVEIADVANQPGYRNVATARAMQEAGLARSMVWVALRKEHALLGFVSVFRNEIHPFSAKQIALLQNFAAQAVIAMENARLLDELRESLDQQTATAEVLQVINSSPGNLTPVFDAMLDKAMSLCGAAFGMLTIFEDARHRVVAARNIPDALAQLVRQPMPVRPETAIGRIANGEPLVSIADAAADEAYRMGSPIRRAVVDLGGARSYLAVALQKDDVPLGAFVIYRKEVRPFTDKQIALLRNFAAQAVIAMENARLLEGIRAARDDAETALRGLKAAQANLIQAEKMASLGQLTAGIAHEIKNPLNFVNNFANLSVELLDELKAAAGPAIAGLDEGARAEIDETIGMLTGNLEKIAEHGRRADGIVRSMLEHSRGGSGERRSVDLNNLVEEALNLAYHGARAQDQSFNITLEREFDNSIAPVELVPQDVTRVFLNLFGNGFYAANKQWQAAGDARFKPTVKVTTRELGDAVEIRVRDNGIGISAEIKDKLFQPFFTTKPTGEGTGLGLSISYDIVTQQHGGTIEVDSQLGEFTEFTIRLPRDRQAASTGAAA